MKAFSFATDKGKTQIGIELDGSFYNFSNMWEIYKQLKSQGRGPRLDFLQIMVEADFLSVANLREVVDSLREVRKLDDLKIKASFEFQTPIGRPQKILCLGRNYKAHAEELGNKVPEEPIFFSKSPSALIAHESEIRIPKDVGRVDYEGEVAVVIGKRARRLSVEKASEYVTGYTLLNDVTARDLQKSDIQSGRPWFRAKSIDTFCPFGPFIVPRDAIDDYRKLAIEVRVNGERKQQASLSDLIFSIEEVIAYISKFCTLEPGDVIATGTPAGVGPLQRGDVVECLVPELGVLRNPVV